jgi:hypothetical protein
MYAAMDHGGHGAHSGHEADHSKMDHSKMDHSKMDHSKMDHSSKRVLETLSVDQLKSKSPTAFAAGAKVHEVKLVLGGDMERYVWHINGKAIHEERNVIINENDVVRFTLVNDTMMHHPMHLHGHFFRVLNQQGEFAPLKHTIDVPPHATRTIEFLANEPGEWMLHCHNLCHMKTGMARVVKYSTFSPKPEVAKFQAQDPHLHDHMYFGGGVGLATNSSSLELKLMQTWNTYELQLENSSYHDPDHWEGGLLYRRWVSQFLNLGVGAVYKGELDSEKIRGALAIGYTLPMLIETELMVDHRGKLGLTLEKRLQWTSHLYSDLEFAAYQGLEPELEASLMYAQSWSWAAGINYSDDKVGAGVQFRF